MLKHSIIIFTLIVSFQFSYAKSKNHDHQNHGDMHNHKMEEGKASIKKVSKGKVVIKVQGMVCAFCAQGIKKNFEARNEVKETNVDLDKMEVEVTYKKGMTLPKKDIQKIVTDAGFKFVGVQ